jgi:hypothetical protein
MMMTFRVQAGWAKMTSAVGQANNTGMPPDQKVNKAEELNYLFIIIELDHFIW